MTAVVVYSILAILIVIMAALLVRQRHRERALEVDNDRDCAHGLWEGPGLSLAERIFDSADYHWLRDELGLPQLARLLACSRKQLALRMLRALKTSFDELVRMPEPAHAEGDTGNSLGSWQLLWLTFRFHFLLSYATLAVRFFGPYHRLVPPLGGWDFVSGGACRRHRYGTAHNSNLR